MGSRESDPDPDPWKTLEKPLRVPGPLQNTIPDKISRTDVPCEGAKVYHKGSCGPHCNICKDDIPTSHGSICHDGTPEQIWKADICKKLLCILASFITHDRSQWFLHCYCGAVIWRRHFLITGADQHMQSQEGIIMRGRSCTESIIKLSLSRYQVVRSCWHPWHCPLHPDFRQDTVFHDLAPSSDTQHARPMSELMHTLIFTVLYFLDTPSTLSCIMRFTVHCCAFAHLHVQA